MRLLSGYIILLILLSVSMYMLLQHVALKNAEKALMQLHERVKNDLQIKYGTWDTALYNADPNTPHPQGSGGFTTPLYIVTRDGFVIERSQPIPGVLDSADFKHLLSFNTPQSIVRVTNDRWRVLSREIKDSQGDSIGVISVAYHNPQEPMIQEIDQRLTTALNTISAGITISKNEIEVKNLDIRNVPYDIAFEIVTQYNKVLLNNGRIPTFIDPSYVDQELKQKEQFRILTNSFNNSRYLLSSRPIPDKANPLGVVVIGHSLRETDALLQTFVTYSLLFNTLVLFPLGVLFLKYLKKNIKSNLQKHQTQFPNRLHFNASQSVIYADKRKIAIPYATNQYVLCKAVFSSPKKRWELDELVKRIGESTDGDTWRKVYDAALALNKKAGFRLIDYKDKTFRMHPDLLPVLS